MYLFLEIILSIIISCIPIMNYFLKKNHEKKEWKYYLLATLILLIGCLVRTILVEKYPLGLNQDEASIGYEAYSVLNYGIDRNGISYPVHFIAWGSGQNALYGYLIMPFIKIFGLSTFAIRFPMAIIGCITLLVAYYLFQNVLDKKKSLIILFIFAIIPWHILKSRWGLEANLFPDLILYSLSFIYFAIKKKKSIYFVLSSIILGLSTYAYGTSYLFVPFFSILMYFYLVHKKEITLKRTFVYFGITTIIALPMILFVIINYFELNEIKIFNITIPRLDYNSFAEKTAINGNFVINCLNNIKTSLLIIFYQLDECPLNYIYNYGLFYMYSLPFLVIGIVTSIKKKNTFYKMNNILFISSIIVAMFTKPNINRLNILMFCLIIYIAIGVISFISKEVLYKHLMAGIFLISFALLICNYFSTYQSNVVKNVNYYGLEEAILYANDLDYNNLYITDNINQPYIYYLYYNKIDPYYYLENRNIRNIKVMFQEIINIHNVYFELPLELEKGNVYILDNQELFRKYIKGFEVKIFNNYSVLY